MSRSGALEGTAVASSALAARKSDIGKRGEEERDGRGGIRKK